VASTSAFSAERSGVSGDFSGNTPVIKLASRNFCTYHLALFWPHDTDFPEEEWQNS
jgi:hypothetical protein